MRRGAGTRFAGVEPLYAHDPHAITGQKQETLSRYNPRLTAFEGSLAAFVACEIRQIANCKMSPLVSIRGESFDAISDDEKAGIRRLKFRPLALEGAPDKVAQILSRKAWMP
jgi:hypothetical protein